MLTHFYNKIKELQDKYIGGEEYFNELDFYIRDQFFNLEPMLISTIINDHSEYIPVLTGDLSHVFQGVGIKFNGGLRGDETPRIWGGKGLLRSAKPLVFIDDSFYSGKTFDKINKFIYNQTGREIKHVYVIYDGSTKERFEMWKNLGIEIKSFYRYHK